MASVDYAESEERPEGYLRDEAENEDGPFSRGPDVLDGDLLDYQEPNEVPPDDDHDEDLPIFANRRNRELNQDVKKLESKLEKSTAVLSENEERVGVMKEHLKNVEQELRHTEQLLEAKTKEKRGEEHLTQLAIRENGRVKSEIVKLKVTKDDIAGKISQVKNEIFKGNDKMDKLKLAMDYDQEELEQWALAAKQQDDDDMAYQRYTRADEAKIKDLNKQLEKLTVERHEKESLLKNEVTETQSKQIELDKTAEEFRSLHKERRQLVKQWHDTIATMQNRDKDIEKTGAEFATHKGMLAEISKSLQSEKARIEMMEQDNIEAEAQIEASNRVLQKQRDEYTKAKSVVDAFKSEVDLLKSELGKAASEVAGKKHSVETQKSNIESLKEKIEIAREKFREAKKKRESRKQEMGSSEENARDAEEFLRSQELANKAMDKELTAMKEKLFKQSQELFKARQEKVSLEALISGTQASSRNLSAQLAKLDEQSLHQQELVYTAQFRIQQLERKVARAKGVRSDEEKKILNKKIEKCKEDLQAAQTQNTMLQTQVKKLEEETRACKRSNVQIKKDHKELNERIAELVLECSSAESHLKQTMDNKEELLVSNDIKKLQVKRLRDQLKARADEVFNLENSKFQLEMSMQERKKEINVHSDTQRARLKTAEEERHKIAMESKERRIRVEKLKLKYATICKNGAVGEDGKERSQAYFVIAAAQKREELQREGDELDAKIRKCDREIRALSNTLNHLNYRNTEFRAGFHKVDPNTKEYKEYKRLEKEYKGASDTLYRKKKELHRLDNDLKEDSRRIMQIQEQTKQVEEHLSHLQSAKEKIDTEIQEQEQLAEKYEDEIARESRLHRELSGCRSDEETLYETLFKAKANQETRDNILYTLKQLAFEFPEIEESLHENVQRYGLAIPGNPPTPSHA